MGDLISRSALVEDFRRIARAKANARVFAAADAWEGAADRIENAPAVDAEPVQHGRWGEYHITGYDGLHPTYTAPCSVCSYEARFTHRFCPNCGAKMDAGK